MQLPTLTNLLPRERIHALRRAYFLRLATVAVLVLAGVAITHAALLAPSYLYAHQEAAERKTELASLNAGLARSEEQEVEARIAALRNNADYLARLDRVPSGSTAIAAILKVPRPGISLTAFNYQMPTDGAATARLSISGVADTRESLRRYDQALSALPFVVSADLPISAYAKETAIDFSVTLTGTLKP